MPAFFIHLIVTILVETPFHLWWLRRRPILQVVFVSILLNGFTLPLATVLYHDAGFGYWWVEAGVVVVEGMGLAVIWRGKGWRMGLCALLANAASVGAGWLLAGWGWI